MARVISLKPNVNQERSPGMISLIRFINSQNKAKVVEISKGAVPFKIDHNWNFDVPIASLNKQY